MENLDFIRMIVSYLILQVLGGVIGFISTKLKKNRKKEQAIEEGVQALLRDGNKKEEKLWNK